MASPTIFGSCLSDTKVMPAWLGSLPGIGTTERVRPISTMERRQESEILTAFEHYRSVSHLWAAAVYGRVQYQADIVPAAHYAIPRFPAYANEFARLSTSLTWAERHPVLELPVASLWVFLLPTALVRQAAAEVRQTADHGPMRRAAPDGGEGADAQS